MPKRIFVSLIILVSLLAPTSAEAQSGGPGRWVDFGKWNGVVDCEASPTPANPHLVKNRDSKRYRAEVRADALNPRSGTRGLFQFKQRTWDWVASLRGQDHLIGVDPRTRTAATQMRQAIYLRRHFGIGHWTCGYRYNDGTGPRYVTGEVNLPNNPDRCAANLRSNWFRSKRVADSICLVP